MSLAAAFIKRTRNSFSLKPVFNLCYYLSYDLVTQFPAYLLFFRFRCSLIVQLYLKCNVFVTKFSIFKLLIKNRIIGHSFRYLLSKKSFKAQPFCDIYVILQRILNYVYSIKSIHRIIYV